MSGNKYAFVNRNESYKKRVFEKNYHLQERILEVLMEETMDYIKDLLVDLEKGLRDYQIGPYSPVILKMKDHSLFLEGLEEVNDAYNILGESSKELLEDTLELDSLIGDMSMGNTHYNRMEEIFEEGVEELKEDMEDVFKKILDDTSYDLMQSFLDMDIDRYIPEGHEVKVTEDYRFIEIVSKRIDYSKERR